MPFLKHQGHRLAYTSFGEGPRTCVFVHGLLLSQKMHRALALELAARGNRVLTLDLLGHGRSDRPRDMTQYSMPLFGEQIVALLDHLEIEEAVIGGTSLGANAALEVADSAPDRVRGLVIEMPVLDNALLACALVFTPLLVALTFGAPVMRVVAAVARRRAHGRRAGARRPRTGHRAPGPGPELRRPAGAVLRAHRTAEGPPAPDRGARAHHRARPRPGAPVLGRRRAPRTSCATPACCARTRSSSCAWSPSASPARSPRSWTSAGCRAARRARPARPRAAGDASPDQAF